ncbi:hypothetical protein PHYBOEH_005589 [Phytophthora boehmeriae]|uniref:Dynein heavy chain n=1 Tax=Phytophthora boehmeriae TaxID=109152 RepID=A0A8T1WL86_9STRA|nr:hypothetical protein PHYBOEH_005589 [Phytophthora boehmeriae]
MDDRLTPSVRRPRTRGARRRPPTPLAPASPFAYSPRDAAFFPTLSTSQRPATPQTVAGDGHTHYNALEERLHASGLKRSVVQAQLFPQAAASRAGNARFLSRKRHEAATALQDNQAVAEMEESLKHKPLVASLNVRPTGSALIPSRPASSSATALTRERQKLKSAGAKTARGYSSFAEAGRGVAKEPMTARDRYYIEQRASTVPGGERQTSRLRPVSREFVGDVKIPTDDQDKRQNIVDSGNNIRSQKPVEGGFTCTDAPDVPRRSDLLARRNEVRTLTDRLVENLTQQTTEESASAYGLSTPNGAVSRDSFFYLRRVDSNPYNLEVTTHSYINPKNYYTVSRLGITHFSQDGVEFQPLEKFERENYIYSLLVKLPFFKKYRTWKRFTIWKRAVNARKRMNAFVSLNNSLFILLPHLHDALFQLRHACLDLQKVNLFDFEHPTGVTDTTVWAADGQQQQQKTYTLSEFSLRLKAQKIRVERLVDQFISNSEMTAKTACENHLYSFLQNTGFNDIKSTGTKDGRKRSAVGTQRKESAGSTGVNICLDQQKAMTYTERATMKTQCRRLTKFLRVVEFLISDALLRMAILSTVLLKDTLATFMKDQDDKDSSGDDEPKKKLTKTDQCEHERGDQVRNPEQYRTILEEATTTTRFLLETVRRYTKWKGRWIT